MTSLRSAGRADLVQLLDHVHGYADRAGLVSQGTRDRLADPPGRIGGELEALAVVELLRSTHQTQGSLLDQVEERQSLVAVVLGDRHHKAQVRLHHLLLGVEVAALDPLGEIDLLLSSQQAYLANVLEEQLQRISGHIGLQVQSRLRPAPTALVRRALDLSLGDGRINLFNKLNLGPLEETVKFLEVRLVEVQLLYCASDLGEREHAELLAAVDESLDLFEFLQFRY